MINQKTLEKLKAIPEKQWGSIYKKLVLYARLKLNKMGFERRTEIDNVSPDDFVGTAIEKVFDGTRAWDFERFPDIEIHLKGVVKSLISNHIKSSSKRPLNEQLFDRTDPIGSEVEISNHLEIADKEDDGLLITEEHWTYIEGQFIDDDDGLIVFYDWLDNIPPRDIATKYNMDVNSVYNAMKRGKRVIASLSKMFKDV